MRADRLLSMMILLQTRGTMTACQLASELEVSERTIYRDIDALSMAGVPVFAGRGPGGGISLLEEYRTNLTGLSGDEVRALFMLNIPSPLLQLGVGQELKAALLKLSAALPEAHRGEQRAARQRIHLDARWWGQSGQPAPHLGIVQRAVWKDHRLQMVTRTVFGVDIERVVEPLGLVAKAGEWHLVARLGGGPRVFRVSRLIHAVELETTFTRPEDFDLAAFWEDYCRQIEAERSLFWVELRVSPALMGELPMRLGEQAESIQAEAGPPDGEGWRRVRMAFDSLEEARDRVLSFGGGAEVLQPLPLRLSVEDYARQTLKIYAPGIS
jgi:predicted DNA-binding transcriptional regulator YafY